MSHTAESRDAIVADLARFIRSSPSSYHAAAEVAARLDQAGFTALAEHAAWPSGPGGRYVVRDGAIIAWTQPEGCTAATPVRIIGAHTDSPGFKLKPNPTVLRHGWLQAGVEIYGGPLLNSWLDRELEFGGRIVTKDGAELLVRTGPMLRIPQLAIHLDREQNAGLILDRQRHTQPVLGVGAADVLAEIARIAGVSPLDIAGYDLLTADTAAPARFGMRDELFAAGRLDNLISVHAALMALSAAPSDAGHISMLAAFDHEELGSQSRSGASGPFLEEVLERIAEGLGASREDRARSLAASWCVSADAAHSVHPNYPEKHDPANHPMAGHGPVLKLNASQRYATDAHGAALWARVCETAGIDGQVFVSNNAVPCGSTIGPLTATRLGIRTVDIGVPLLSMHSARELCHVDDVAELAAAATAFYAGA